MKTLNVPAAIVLATTISSFLAAVVAALIWVPEHTWHLLGRALTATPWPVVFAVGTPLVVSFVAALRQAWHGPLLEKKKGDEKADSSTPPT